MSTIIDQNGQATFTTKALQAASFMTIGVVFAALFFRAVEAETALHALEKELIETSKETQDGALRVYRDSRKRLRVEALLRAAEIETSDLFVEAEAVFDPASIVTNMPPLVVGAEPVFRPSTKIANLAPDYFVIVEDAQESSGLVDGDPVFMPPGKTPVVAGMERPDLR